MWVMLLLTETKCTWKLWLSVLFENLTEDSSSEELLHRAGEEPGSLYEFGRGGGVQGMLRITCSQGYVLVKDYC